RKAHRKKAIDSDSTASDSMNVNDTASGATMPSPKKGPHAFDGAGPRGGFAANDRDGHPGGPPDKKGGGGHDQGIFGKGPLDLTALNLTDEQKQKIGQMHSENGAKMRDL